MWTRDHDPRYGCWQNGYLRELLTNELRPQVNSMLALAGACASIACVGICSLNGVIRSPGAIHDFIVFLASGIATKESCISRLEIKGG